MNRQNGCSRLRSIVKPVFIVNTMYEIGFLPKVSKVVIDEAVN